MISCYVVERGAHHVHIRGAKKSCHCLQPPPRQYHHTPIQGQGRRGTGCRCCCWSAGAGLHHAGLLRAYAARRLHASSSSGRWRRQDPLTTPRRATARRGFFVASVRSLLPSHALQGWQGGTRCGMLDSMILYNRPRRRDEVADFVAASGGDYTFLAAVRLALCSRLPISSRLSSAQARATADAGACSARGTHRGAEGGHRTRAGARTSRGEASPRADVRGGWGLMI